VIIAGVNDTGDKLFIGVNINGDVLLLVIIYDTDDETIATISACLQLKVNLMGQWHKIFDFRFSCMDQFPPSP
jgi:hypothetical protein